MTYDDIPLLPAVRRRADLLRGAVARGLRALVRRFGTPAGMLRSNAAACSDVSYALVQMRRLHRILRYVFISVATHFVDDRPARAPQAPIDAPADARRGARLPVTDDPATWRMTFTTSRRYRGFVVHTDEKRPSPFARVPAAPLLTLARKMEGLRRALADPMRHVRRLARVLRGGVSFIAWRPPKRRPPLASRDFWEELEIAWEQACFDLRRLNTS